MSINEPNEDQSMSQTISGSYSNEAAVAPVETPTRGLFEFNAQNRPCQFDCCFGEWRGYKLMSKRHERYVGCSWS